MKAAAQVAGTEQPKRGKLMRFVRRLRLSGKHAAADDKKGSARPAISISGPLSPVSSAPISSRPQSMIDAGSPPANSTAATSARVLTISGPILTGAIQVPTAIRQVVHHRSCSRLTCTYTRTRTRTHAYSLSFSDRPQVPPAALPVRGPAQPPPIPASRYCNHSFVL